MTNCEFVAAARDHTTPNYIWPKMLMRTTALHNKLWRQYKVRRIFVFVWLMKTLRLFSKLFYFKYQNLLCGIINCAVFNILFFISNLFKQMNVIFFYSDKDEGITIVRNLQVAIILASHVIRSHHHQSSHHLLLL